MKKLLASAIGLLLCVLSQAQINFPNNQYISSPATLYHMKGAAIADSGWMIAVRDTLNHKATDVIGTLTIRPQDKGLYLSQGGYWIRIGGVIGGGGGTGITDSIYVDFPLYVDTISRPGIRILKIRHANGLESGGIVTQAACLAVGSTPAIYDIGFKQYQSPETVLNVTVPDASFPRTDEVIVDTFGMVSILTGVPSATPLPISINPSSQLVISTYTVAAGATCLGIQVQQIYDENAGGEFTHTQSGTQAGNFDNTDNPQQGAKAFFTTTFADGATTTFTNPTGVDTVQLGQILKHFFYFNGAFGGQTGQIQEQFFLNTTPVTNNLVINPYFNPLDSGRYQNCSVPLTAWQWSGNNWDKLVMTLRGNDLTGAKGFYTDNIQLQTGNTNVNFNPVTVYSFEKNATRDSIILTMSDRSRFAVLDSSGAAAAPEITADNGLLKTVNNIQLGGESAIGAATLLHNSYINNGNSSLLFTGTADDGQAVIQIDKTGSASKPALQVNVIGAYGSAIRTTGGSDMTNQTGTALGLLSYANYPLQVERIQNPGNTVLTVLQINRQSLNVAVTAGLGSSIDFGNASLFPPLQLVAKYLTVGSGTGSDEFSVIGNIASTPTTFFTVSKAAGFGLFGPPPASAIFSTPSTTKGFLPPVMTAVQGSAIASPTEGLMIYVTTTNGTFLTKGWYGYNGAAWEKLNN